MDSRGPCSVPLPVSRTYFPLDDSDSANHCGMLAGLPRQNSDMQLHIGSDVTHLPNKFFLLSRGQGVALAALPGGRHPGGRHPGGRHPSPPTRPPNNLSQRNLPQKAVMANDAESLAVGRHLRGMALAALPGGRHPSPPPRWRQHSQGPTLFSDVEGPHTVREFTARGFEVGHPFLVANHQQLTPMSKSRDHFVEHTQRMTGPRVRQNLQAHARSESHGRGTSRGQSTLDENVEDTAPAPSIIVALDVDEVLVCYVDSFRKFLVRERPEGPFDVESVFREAHDPNSPWRLQFASTGGLDSLEAMPGAMAALRRLKLAGVQLEIVTSRPSAMRQSTEALLGRLFPPGTFSAAHFVGPGEKGHTCNAIGALALVDDQIPNVIDANACGVISVLFDLGGGYPWSVCSPDELPAGVVRLESWAATCEYLLSALQRSARPGAAIYGNGNPQAPLSADTCSQALLQDARSLQRSQSATAMRPDGRHRSPTPKRRDCDEVLLRQPTDMSHRSQSPDQAHLDHRMLHDYRAYQRTHHAYESDSPHNYPQGNAMTHLGPGAGSIYGIDSKGAPINREDPPPCSIS